MTETRLRVANFARNIPGPLAGRLLADLGAEVIKVENPKTGDGNRQFRPLIHGTGIFGWALNAGSKSLAVDPHDELWAPMVHKLVEWADVVIFAGGEARAAKLGIDFQTLVAINPRLVYVSITGYGEHGPWRDLAAHGLDPDALAGVLPIQWTDDGTPIPASSYQSVGAPLSGVFAALGAYAAVRRRDETGEAQFVHVSLLGSAVWSNWRNMTTLANLGEPWWSYEDFGSRYAAYATSDGRVFLLAALERRFWHRTCELLDLPAELRDRGRWEEDAGVDRGFGYDDEKALIADKIRQRPLEHWQQTFVAAGVPFAPVLTARELLDSEQSAANGFMSAAELDGAKGFVTASPIDLHSGPGLEPASAEPLRVPVLGSDNDAVLRMLGLEDDGD